ncbi:GNAT family N-acetyltransferase [Corynebacterium terpenotabidum]|uniref:Putative ribosomal protein N-acetylase n=1 Tax=Corynebacterium terpenotabidum Y-11 TaxID=1200352 RepID=S4XJP4_9CORY|nr:GNAT family protein [Corynebacterium terpenotabidum]AGP31965.1 putative ribosomal protein N-acetylase [Corynebacterium terpenotabidum Y-11]
MEPTAANEPANEPATDPATVPITTERLILRTYLPGDETWMHAVYSRPEVTELLLDEPWTRQYTLNRLGDRLMKTDLLGPTGTLALVIEYQGVPVGDVMIWTTTYGNAEMGWVLNPDYGGRGLAAEAVTAVIAHAFARGLHRVVAQMDARNTASAKLARRVGLTQEAHFHSNWWNKGEWTDTLVFATVTG